MNKLTAALGLISVFAVSGCETPQTNEKATVQTFSTIELNGPMPEAFEEFVDHVETYGALYVTKTGGGGGRVGGQKNLEDAKYGALQQCKIYNPTKECILYATKTP